MLFLTAKIWCNTMACTLLIFDHRSWPLHYSQKLFVVLGRYPTKWCWQSVILCVYLLQKVPEKTSIAYLFVLTYCKPTTFRQLQSATQFPALGRHHIKKWNTHLRHCENIRTESKSMVCEMRFFVSSGRHSPLFLSFAVYIATLSNILYTIDLQHWHWMTSVITPNCYPRNTQPAMGSRKLGDLRRNYINQKRMTWNVPLLLCRPIASIHTMKVDL